MSATIDGQSWTATAVAVEHDTSGVRITATSGPTGPSRETLELQFRRTGEGVQLLEGLTGGRYGRFAVGSFSISIWQTGSRENVGTLTVTTLTSARVAGTFAFTAGPWLPTTAPEVRRVTDGAFDVTF